ncbi:MAG: hypothetical protein ACI9LM_004241 [Alteromonadaceae bacterium]|jgi:hypothetical protein
MTITKKTFTNMKPKSRHPQSRFKRPVTNSNYKPVRSLRSITPKPVDAEIEDKIEKCEKQYEEYLTTSSPTVIPSFAMKTFNLNASCEEALHDLLNLEINGDYLSEQRLSSWKSVIVNAKLFYRLLIYVSISFKLPKVKGMTQGQYFSEFFDLSSDSVVKTFKNTEILVFLYLGASHINQLKDPNLLMSIGNENDLVCNKLIEVQKQYGDAFLLKVFQECQEKVKSISEIKKITGTLVKAVAESHAKQLDLIEVTNKGAIDDYTTVELSSLEHITPENHTDYLNTKSEIGISELISNIRIQKSTLSKLTTNKDKYDPNEIGDLLDAIEELQKLADSLS